MNAVEIEQAISALAEQPFDPAEFAFAFLQAFGNKVTTLKRLRAGASNKSDLGGVLQTNNIHIAVCPPGQVTRTLISLKDSPATTKAKARFALATDGADFEAEDLQSGETVACAYKTFPDHFGFFLPLAGISTVKQVRENAFDIRATSRLNRLYVELLRNNPEWGEAARSHDMNHFMARLIFCFFAEDTDIFNGSGLFTATVDHMSERDASNTHLVIGEMFRAMNTKIDDRAAAGLPRWADVFPYVNGGLFSGNLDVPRFSKIARSYLLHIGNLDWKKINPDIFGSMIQAVAEDEERGALGLHYTSVPNILKVLNPLFLDDLREKLKEADDNPRKLLNLRNRMARIHVFDPACGSGNFLVIAYKEMRAIEAQINHRRGEAARRTEIPLTNFRGIELRDFPAEIARLALIIAEFQCDVLYRGQKEALAEFLPLNAENWITCGNALRLDWQSICPTTGTGVKHYADDLLHTPLDQAQIDFEHQGGETYICGNPPYSGYNKQGKAQKADLKHVFQPLVKNWGNLDYVAAWFAKAALFMAQSEGATALVATNSVCQGGQVSILWPLLNKLGAQIHFAYTSFKWSNLAANNAGISVIVLGLSQHPSKFAKLFDVENDGTISVRSVPQINGYLIPGPAIYVSKRSEPISALSQMSFGNHPYYGAALIISPAEARELVQSDARAERFLRPIFGSTEVIKGVARMCIWIPDEQADAATDIVEIAKRLESVRVARNAKTDDATALVLANTPHRFRDVGQAKRHLIAVPQTTSENREYLPCALMEERALVTFKCYALYDAPLWNMALIASKLHIAWIGAVCGRLEMRFSYSNTLGWNTFPVPSLTEKNKADLTRCAEEILLARESYFPATIADLYDPEKMPSDLRQAHEHNDLVLERIYIGRNFRNDTERLEKLFDMYTKMTAGQGTARKRKIRVSA
jgi:hypothetical protein